MVTKLRETDVVIVGMGWTGGILAKELAEAGMKVVALERGRMRTPADDFAVPNIRDELRYTNRNDLMMNTAQDTLTVRNLVKETALPMRRLGSFLPGSGVGGAGAHWNGHTWRWTDHEFKIRSHYEQTYGKSFIPDDMTIQDWGISYEELEPYYDKFEYTAGISGKAGNIKGKIDSAGNVFEAPRARDYPLPPLESPYSSMMFEGVARDMGLHPFKRPTANASRAYTNPDGSQFGACQYCGFCERYGCEANAKGSPLITVVPIAMRNANFELRTNSWVQKVLLDSTGKKATGVLYVNMSTGEEFEQPASLVLLCAYGLNNVHLLMLSGVGQIYDPESQKGLVGKNYSYQIGTSAQLFFEDKIFNPFMATGGTGSVCDDYNVNMDFDRGKAGFVGGASISSGGTNGRPIEYRPLPPGSPRWGSQWKKNVAKWYNSTMSVSSSGSVMASRYNYLDLDPTYKNIFGAPLMRMTFEYAENERKQNAYMATVVNKIVDSMNPTFKTTAVARASWSVVPYQTTHNTGGAIMGTNPGNSVVNNYLQSWDVSNLFVMGASAFPHNAAYNPTGPVGAMAYRTAEVIKTRYKANPGPLL